MTRQHNPLHTRGFVWFKKLNTWQMKVRHYIDTKIILKFNINIKQSCSVIAHRYWSGGYHSVNLKTFTAYSTLSYRPSLLNSKNTSSTKMKNKRPSDSLSSGHWDTFLSEKQHISDGHCSVVTSSFDITGENVVILQALLSKRKALHVDKKRLEDVRWDETGAEYGSLDSDQ